MDQPVESAGEESVDERDQAEARREESRPEDVEVARLRLQRIQTVALSVLAVLAVAFGIRMAAPVLIPIVIALLFSFLLSPLVRRLRGWGLGAPLAAALVMLLVTAGLGYGAVRLAGPAQEWMQELPGDLRQARRKLEGFSSKMGDVQKAAEEVDGLAQSMGGGDKGARKLVVELDEGRGFLTGARSFAASAFVCWFLLLFLLSSQDSFMLSLVRVLPRLHAKKLAVEVLRGIQREVSRYLLTITSINLGLGAAIALAMYLLGMPNPFLWGAMAALFNFIPYAGAIVGAVIVGFVALIQDGIEPGALFVPAAYLALSGIEGMLITPAVVGRRLRLRPVIVFLGVLLWSWLWGVAGALLAIPMLVVLHILCRHVELLRPMGEFLSESAERAEAPVRKSPPEEQGVAGVAEEAR